MRENIGSDCRPSFANAMFLRPQRIDGSLQLCCGKAVLYERRLWAVLNAGYGGDRCDASEVGSERYLQVRWIAAKILFACG